MGFLSTLRQIMVDHSSMDVCPECGEYTLPVECHCPDCIDRRRKRKP